MKNRVISRLMEWGQSAARPMVGQVAASIVVLFGCYASAQADTDWNIVATSPGESSWSGVVTTGDIPQNCNATSEVCGVSGTLTIPAGALGGPGTTIDLAEDLTYVTVVLSAFPPAAGDRVEFGFDKDGYFCTGQDVFLVDCSWPGSSASFDLALTPASSEFTVTMLVPPEGWADAGLFCAT